MCVIIQRDPGIILPEDKIWSACKVNSDGYGISVIDRGKIETIREFDPKGNDSKLVMKRLEDAKDHPVFLHLRFKTGGVKGVDNCHPFTVLNREQDKLDLQFMHNGTLFKFNTDKHFSDTYVFNEKILKPLIRKMKPFYDMQEDKNILGDATIYAILQEYAGAGSIFTLYDANGNSMIINRDKGFEHEDPETKKKWWSSNNYSFNQYHRDDSKRYESYWQGRHNASAYGYGSYDGSADEWEGDNVNDLPFEPTTETSRKALPPPDTQESEEQKDLKILVETSNAAAKHIAPTIIPPQQRDTFVSLAGISSLSQLQCLEAEDINDIVNNYPEAASILIMDLLYELYLKDTAIKGVKRGG